MHILFARLLKFKFLANSQSNGSSRNSLSPLASFSHEVLLVVFHRSLSDSQSPQVSRSLLSIQAVLNNAVVWMLSTRPPTSKSSSAFCNPLVTLPNAPITIGMIVTCMFHSFLSIP